LRFLNTTISQGSVATRFRFSGIFNYFLPEISVKEF